MSTHKSRLRFVIVVVAGIALFAFLPTAAPVAADGTVTDCSNDSQLSALLPQGGNIFFNCAPSGAYTITVSNELVITTSVSIDGANGGNPIVLSGGNARRIFSINNGVTVNLSNMTVTNGRALSGDGGNILNLGKLYLTDVTVSNGSVTPLPDGAFGKGGGIYNAHTLIIIQSTISGNSAFFNTNHTSGHGGGIYSTGLISITNSTLSGNRADGQGGGLFSSGALSSLLNDTLASNMAGDSVDGSGNLKAEGSLTLQNTILAGGVFSNCSASTTFTSLGHNLSDDFSCGSLTAVGDMRNTPANLGALSNNGGPTLTYALLRGSPAIDAGDNVGCPPTDQRGVTRPVDGDGDGIAVCDIGAYEANQLFKLFLPLILR